MLEFLFDASQTDSRKFLQSPNRFYMSNWTIVLAVNLHDRYKLLEVCLITVSNAGGGLFQPAIGTGGA